MDSTAVVGCYGYCLGHAGVGLQSNTPATCGSSFPIARSSSADVHAHTSYKYISRTEAVVK